MVYCERSGFCKNIFNDITILLRKYKPQLVAIESIFVYKNRKSNTKTIVFEKPIEIDHMNFKKIKELEIKMKDNIKQTDEDYLYYHPNDNIREEKSEELALKGEEPLDPYEFDYLLLCNKICGKSHYNMQMKIIVETQQEFDTWYEQQTLFKKSLIAQN